MSLEKLESMVSRVFFLGALLLLVSAVTERIANELEYTILRVVRAATMLDTAVVLLVFVIAIEVRGIREALKRQA
jgi:hypothetical protein